MFGVVTMCNIRSQLTEQVTILVENTVTDELSYERYVKCYETRANIQPLGQTADRKCYLITLPYVPTKFSGIQPVGVLWNDMEYIFISHLKPCGRGFLKCIASPAE